MMELYADSSRGVYIPQFFATSVNRDCVAGVSDWAWEQMERGPDYEWYWDAWTEALDNAVLTDPETGEKLRLWQDGDLWLVGENEELPED